MSKRFIRDEKAIWRRIGDDVVVIKDDGLSTHVLNKTAAQVWDLCDGTHDIDEIVTILCERFEVTIDQARTDVSEIMEKMLQVNILINNGGSDQ
jgi:hypothetical protein